ncbi:hypothetical protein Cgig2_005767 [Carnegiea gigantea]|uniref:Uncharacterized protein n=1 Tax=Carnegiea gigantea TaxID=171969 RepID=A0A9Q1JI02_9CARY|nr:hypothetical protein Cgig2_005767 [Carnegiea gigantea]
MRRALPGPLGKHSCMEHSRFLWLSRGVVLRFPQCYPVDMRAVYEGDHSPGAPYSSLWRIRGEPRWDDPTPTITWGQGKVRNLEVELLVVDVPTAYNVILGRPTLHKFEADDGSISKLQGDQQIAQECYLISIQPLAEQSIKRGPTRPPPSDKR